jgi:hypothetical protein
VANPFELLVSPLTFAGEDFGILQAC